VSRLTRGRVTCSEAAVVIDKASERKLRSKVLSESVEVHFLECWEAVWHHQARELFLGFGWFVQPSTEDDIVAGLELDVFTSHHENQKYGLWGRWVWMMWGIEK
jgi:hypothetical protein